MLRNFRFVIEGKLAGMGHPGYRDTLPHTLQELRKRGIGALVSLDEEGLPDDLVAKAGFRYRHFPVDDFRAPSLAQAKAFVEFVDGEIEHGHGVVAHCWAGIGRTGTMLACYLIHQGQSAVNAVRKVRGLGGIESHEQESFLYEFEAACRVEREGDPPPDAT
jgi:atypical dual specificity phosphatase